MIERNKYLSLLIDSRNNGFPKVITGIRRCGKSYLLSTIFKQYLLNHDVSESQILILSRDDDVNARLRDPINLGEFVRNYCKGKGKCFVFIDEIQKVYTLVNPELSNHKHVLAKAEDKEIVSFVDVVLGLSKEPGIDLYITGSNSKRLSTDIITEFRDKATNIKAAPLSFDEFYQFVGGSSFEAIYQYSLYGGRPLAILKKDDQKKDYLKSLFTTTYFQDILEHNHLKNSESLDELANIIASSCGELLNADKIAKRFASIRHEKITRQTISDYLKYFEDAFLLHEARRFDVKGKKEIGAQRKYYFSDTGLRNARLNFAFPDEGQMLENIVYNELLYQGYTVNVGTFDSFDKDNGKTVRKTNEIDFFAVKGFRQFYIQVCLDYESAKTREREVRPFGYLHDQVQKIIVLNKPIKETRDENGYIVIGAPDFLLRFIK